MAHSKIGLHDHDLAFDGQHLVDDEDVRVDVDGDREAVVEVGGLLQNSPETTQEMADAILEREIPRYMAQALSVSPVLAAHPNKLGAITSFVFNLGIARYRSSTLRRKVDAQDWEGSADELPKWVYGGGRKLEGLVKRRDKEREFFLL